MKGTNFKDFKTELLKDKNILDAYNALNPKYEIIETIIARRNEKSMSQRDLARLVGMKQPAICRLERGDKNITVHTLFKVADALDLEIACKPKTLLKV
jgi:predicted transcriptional regulator